MIRHIFKVIWNERKANAWIVLEFFVVFCILWFCIDYFFFSAQLFLESQGYDTNHVYIVNIEEDENVEPVDKETKIEFTQTILDRIRQYPGVETVSISQGSIPNSNWNYNSSYWINGDSLASDMVRRYVTPEFFEVFKIELVRGRLFENDPTGSIREIVISPLRNGMFGSYPDGNHPVNEARTIRDNDSVYHHVVGVIPKMRSYLNQPFTSNVFFPIPASELKIDAIRTEITFRVAASADDDFATRFNKQMEEVLSVGPYIFRSVTPIQESIDKDKKWFSNQNLKSVVAISVFLIANIFLGIIGTFWSRIQSRRSEIGLRIALGSSKRKVKLMMFAETIFMLLGSSILATYVCLNLGQSDFLKTFGIPTADRILTGTGGEQDVINYLVTFLVLVVISGLAVWYPARLSTNKSPAESLREE